MNQSNKLKKHKARETTPPDDPAGGAPTSSATAGAVNDKLTTIDVLQNTSTFLEILKSVGDAAQVLGPLKAICGVLKIATDTAVLLVNNGEDLQELVDLLQPQQTFLESEVAKLSNSEYSNSDKVQDLVEPLKTYSLDLKSLHDKLDTIKARYNDKSKRKRMKTALMAQSDRDQITGFTKKLENSFRHFMHSVTSFIARQTLLMRNEMASMQENITKINERMEENDALNKLSYASARGHQHDICAEGTRVDILEQIRHWANGAASKPIFAIIDRAGTGKSTIASTMAREWEENGSLLSPFFFSKPTLVAGTDVPSTIAKDIFRSIPSLRPLIVEALKDHENFTACSLRQQLEWLVFTPLKSLDIPKIMVIDALDECSKDDRVILLKCLLDFVASFPKGTCPLKILLTCRPEEDLFSRVHEARYVESVHHANFSLHSNQNESNTADIRLYAAMLLSNYLTLEQLDRFVKRADGLFIWAATVQKFITEALDPLSRFEALMVSSSIHSPLSVLYNEILDACLRRVGLDGEDMLRNVLGTISIAREPLAVDVIDELLGLRAGVAGRVVMMLQSVLAGGSDGETVQIMHPTFLEHLQESKSCCLVIVGEEMEPVVAKGCLTVLLCELKYDICDTFRSTKPLYDESGDFDGVEKPKDLEQSVKKKTTPGLLYAAVYALSHVIRSLHSPDIVGQLRTFFKTRLLNWIELMSLLYKVVILLQVVHHLKEQINEMISESQGNVTSDDLEWCEDILNMLRPLQFAIEVSSSQVYFSALPFTPVTCHIAACYVEEFRDKIPRVIRGRQTKKRQAIILTGHSGPVRGVAYSSDNRYLASASEDSTVEVWDSATGAAIYTLFGHTEALSLVISPDNQQIASGSADGTIRIWETTTHTLSHTLTGHTRDVYSLKFSPCGHYIASGSWDNTVRIWDSTTGSTVNVLTSHTGLISCVSFSPDGSYLASGSVDGYAKIYDAATGATIHTLATDEEDEDDEDDGDDGDDNDNDDDDDGDEDDAEEDVAPVTSLAFSPDGRYIATLSTIIQIWDGVNGVLIGTLGSQTQLMDGLLFSPDGKCVVSSIDNTVMMWGVATGSPIHTLTGHTRPIRCIELSPDGRSLASGSEDRTVRIWDFITGAPLHIFTGHTDLIRCLSFSPDGRHLASGSNDHTVYIWDLKSTSAHAIYMEDISGPTSSVHQPHLVSGAVDMTGVAIDKAVGHSEPVTCIKFSPDGQYLVSGSDDTQMCIWDAATGENLHTLTGHTNSIRCLAFSPDGKYLASGSWDRSVRIWDVATGTSIGEPLYHPGAIHSMSFHSWQGKLLLATGYSSYITSSNLAKLWNLSISPPSQLPIQDLPTASLPIKPSLVKFTNPWTYIPSASILFSLPSYFNCSEFCSYGGKLAYGGRDGSVIIIDCSHLL